MQPLLIITLILGILLSGCVNPHSSSVQPKSDTTRVIELAIRTAFRGYLPDHDALKKKYYFKDSILFCSSSLPVAFIPPVVDSLKFKILSEEEVCNIMMSDSLSQKQANYLCLRSFEKSDTGYYLQLSSLSCFPFGGGGSLGLYISKQNDSFLITKKQAVSIN